MKYTKTRPVNKHVIFVIIEIKPVNRLICYN